MNYELLKKLLSLLLRLKATYEPLLDGRVVVEINGYAKTERLKIAVQNGIPSVEATDEAPEVSFGHLGAMHAFFVDHSPERQALSPVVRSWLPLPIYIYHADNV